jgi:adenine C2-methylase RlmN of 23S rRNA A2503 and tRNA A37
MNDIRDLGLEEVKALVAELGEKPYRAKQLCEVLPIRWTDLGEG